MPFESQIIDIIEGKKTAPLTQGFLKGLSYAYGLINTLRNFGYNKSLLSTKKALLPVVSIGNIVVGGTGKTPLVIYLAKQLQTKVAVLSRGFRSEVQQSSCSVLIDHLSGLSASFYGDEPFLISKHLPDAMVIVGKNRIDSAKKAFFLGAKLLLLDDGMQYRKLKRDFEIISMDAQDLFGRGFYLPRGFLRDSPKRLKDADLLVINNIKDHEQLKSIEKILKPYHECPVVAMRSVITNSPEVMGKKVAAFCAIAKPDNFFSSLKECGALILEQMKGLDHESFTQEALLQFSKQAKAKGAEILVCTEKDEIKFLPNYHFELPVISLKKQLEIISGESAWKELIFKIHQKIKHVEMS